MKTLISILLTGVFLSLSACGWLGIRNRSNDYLLSEETQPVVVPDDLDADALGQLYPIPPIPVETVELVDFEAPRPQSAAINTFEQLVKIQSLSDKRWILINIPPSEVWPRLRSLLVRSGIPVSRAEGSTGVLETVWIKFNNDEEKSHRFRISVAPSVQPDSTEITVLQSEAPRGQEEGTPWPESSIDDQREMDMVQLVANELAVNADSASVSLLAQNIGGESKVSLVTPEVADPYILIKLDFDRSWASVTYSATRGGFTTVDLNQSEGVIYVNYTEPEEEEDGFFSRLFSRSKKDEVLHINHQILLRRSGADVQVRIVGPEGQALERREATALLRILRSNLT